MIVDTSALAAIAFEEPDYATYDAALRRAEIVRISVANLVELSNVLTRTMTTDESRLAVDTLIAEYQLSPEPVDDIQWRLAADALFRFGQGRHPARLNFGDSFAYALPKASGEPLLFKGDDFIHTHIERAIA